MRAQNAADDDSALHLALADLDGFQLDFAVTEQDRVAFFDAAGEATIVHRDREFSPENLSCGQNERAARRQPDTISRHFADADLGAGQVLQDGHRLIQVSGDAPNLSNYALVKRMVA